jgi:transcription initiation factor TFIID subunit TAF12
VRQRPGQGDADQERPDSRGDLQLLGDSGDKHCQSEHLEQQDLAAGTVDEGLHGTAEAQRTNSKTATVTTARAMAMATNASRRRAPAGAAVRIGR